MRINETVRRMVPTRYTRSDAAALVGRDADTLKRWKKDGTFVPSESRQFGGLTVDLYSEDDIKAMKRLTRGRSRIPA
jgi:hypothetical protein